MVRRLVIGAVLVGIVVLARQTLPDVVRYLKIKAM
jgi:hypothetical protein